MPVPVCAFTRPGTALDPWSWMDVLVEDTVRPLVTQSLDRGVYLGIRLGCAVRLCSPELQSAWAEAPGLKGTVRAVGSDIVMEVRREWNLRYGLILGGTAFNESSLSLTSGRGTEHTFAFPPTEVLTSLESVEVYTHLQGSSLTGDAHLVEWTRRALGLPLPQREVFLSLVGDGMVVQPAWESALLLS